MLWSLRTESNRRPLPYQGSALPTELRRRKTGNKIANPILSVNKKTHFLKTFFTSLPLLRALYFIIVYVRADSPAVNCQLKTAYNQPESGQETDANHKQPTGNEPLTANSKRQTNQPKTANIPPETPYNQPKAAKRRTQTTNSPPPTNRSQPTVNGKPTNRKRLTFHRKQQPISRKRSGDGRKSIRYLHCRRGVLLQKCVDSIGQTPLSRAVQMDIIQIVGFRRNV